MTQEILEMQEAIVSHLVALAGVSWERMFMNIELEKSEDGWMSNCLSFYIGNDSNDESKTLDLPPLPQKILVLFGDLCLEMTRYGNDLWGTCDVEINKSGEYRFKFDYSQPKRLNGIFDEKYTSISKAHLAAYVADAGRSKFYRNL